MVMTSALTRMNSVQVAVDPPLYCQKSVDTFLSKTLLCYFDKIFFGLMSFRRLVYAVKPDPHKVQNRIRTPGLRPFTNLLLISY